MMSWNFSKKGQAMKGNCGWWIWEKMVVFVLVFGVRFVAETVIHILEDAVKQSDKGSPLLPTANLSLSIFPSHSLLVTLEQEPP
jgi:hypothetical protein